MIFVTALLRASLWGDGRDGCDLDARSAGAGVHLLDAGRARGRAGGGAAGDHPAAPGPGVLRVRRPATPAAGHVPGVPEAEPGVCGDLLAALRLGGAGDGDLGAGG